MVFAWSLCSKWLSRQETPPWQRRWFVVQGRELFWGNAVKCRWQLEGRDRAGQDDLVKADLVDKAMRESRGLLQ